MREEEKGPGSVRKNLNFTLKVIISQCTQIKPSLDLLAERIPSKFYTDGIFLSV